MNFIPGPAETRGRRLLDPAAGWGAARKLLFGRGQDFPGGARGKGNVAIVGAGPGDPELLTVKALRLLSQAEVLIHDRLVDPRILDYANPFAERIDVGKSKGNHSATQDHINDLLVRHARTGRRVVRLKGGDPFIFGRGGEEVDHLREAGIEAEVVPGITAAAGCAASTGIPLTHRDFSSAVTFVTGHGKDGKGRPDWAELARSKHTLVIYMGVSAAAGISEALIANGRDRHVPVAVVENGTRPEQKCARGSLGELANLIEAHEITGPALIVVGDVAALGAREAVSPLSLALAV